MAIDHYGYGIGGWIPKVFGGDSAVFTEGTDSYWMSIALEEGMKAVGLASPNPTVGCVFVKDGILLAKGATEHFGGAHGERVAARRLEGGVGIGSTVYVTLEPCSHQGKQRPCVELLLGLGIKRCVIAMVDPFKKVNGEGIRFLREHGVQVDLGILSKEAIAWHLPFLYACYFSKPLLVGKWAQTFDGHLADDGGTSQWITGPEARAYTHFLRQKYDAIMLGSGTVIADHPSLNVRSCQGAINRSPFKIIVDPKGQLLDLPKEVRSSIASKTLVGEPTLYCGPRHRGTWLEGQNNVHLLLQDQIDSAFIGKLETIYLEMYDRPLQSIFVEGGPKLLNRLIDADLIDVFHTFQRPSLLGGQENRIGSKGPQAMEDKRDLYLLGTSILGQDIVVESISQTVARDIWQGSLNAINALKNV